MIDTKRIPKDILPYLLEISNRLWSGHAAIMIGSGFSKNAVKSESTKKKFPNWNELGDTLYEKLYGSTPKNSYYLNVLKLADEVQAAFGRNTLDQILKSEIPDKEFQPSKLHEKTLKLPWNDVFTTNYDTLLERAAEKVLQHRYETVINKEDLVLSTRPRIIKLHGSFPSERPFIISEEDYRKYPNDFAPFVNTVQQSLLENTLCLIGFSGDDPNFLKWIGWIRDNLGKDNSPKIFLIGVLDLSIGQKKLLEERNIIPINLGDCKEIDGNHNIALNLFIDFLTEQGKKDLSLNWPNDNITIHFDFDKDINSNISKIIENWRKNRTAYPNWIILPEDRRRVLLSYTEDYYQIINRLDKISQPKDIELLYEYNWRIEKCLTPIFNDLIKHYQRTVFKYNPFPNKLEIEHSLYNPKNNVNFDWEKITIYWLEILISMMRFYREEGFHKDWGEIVSLIEKIKSNLNPELSANYHYERCLYQLFLLDIAELRKEINSWPIDNSLPYWETKRAGLLAELGEVSEAEIILEASLNTVRNKLNLSPISSDYLFISQEAYILQMLKYVKSSLDIIRRNFKNDEKYYKDYTERWNKLAEFKCDPWADFDYFNIALERKIPDFKKNEKKIGFDIGTQTLTRNLGGDKNAQIVYSFLRYIEVIGIPFRLPGTTFGKEIAINAVTYISNYSPYWAFASFVRIGNTKEIESIFGRKSLVKMNSNFVNDLTLEYLNTLKKSEKEIAKGDAFINSSFAISLSTILPEILSRLCVKCNYETKLILLDFIKSIYKSDYKDKYKGVSSLTRRLIRSFSNQELFGLIPFFMEFPILDESNRIGDSFIDPFYYIKIENKKLKNNQKIDIDSSIINKYFEIGKKSPISRKDAIKRLIFLYEMNLLSKQQINQLGDFLWQKKDPSSGFPTDTNFDNFVFLDLPHPSNIEPYKLLKKYIASTPFPIASIKSSNGIEMMDGYYPILINILGTTNLKINYTWNKDEIKDLIKKLIEWWDSDKHFLLKQEDDNSIFGSIVNEFKKRFRHLISILSYIVSKHIDLIVNAQKKEIIRVINELPNYNLSNLEVKVAFYEYFSDNPNSLNLEINKSIFSSSREILVDCLNAILLLTEKRNIESEKHIQAISENIKCYDSINIDVYINVMRELVVRKTELINQNVLENIEIGLTNLINRIKIQQEDTLDDISNKLIIKRSIAKLTVALKEHYDIMNVEIPNYIIVWKDICLDKEEFYDIRKIWII
ncbi:MAG: SIR2 family protein [Bacteroidales bacterium]|nr:MAG: SIR2 family protein [Bacteroidales bacterium]